MMSEIAYVVAIAGFAAIVMVWVKQWKSDTEVRFSDLKKVATSIYKLSNSHMGEQLSLNVVVTQRLADLTGNEEDIKVANMSKARYEEHQKRQAVVDAENVDLARTSALQT